jgi:hypothetical protein
MNRRGFIARALAAVAGVALAPLAKSVAPKVVLQKPTVEEIIAIMQTDIDRVVKKMQLDFNKWVYQPGPFTNREKSEAIDLSWLYTTFGKEQ